MGLGPAVTWESPEAEPVAFVVCHSVGLKNGTVSQNYIQLQYEDSRGNHVSAGKTAECSAHIVAYGSPLSSSVSGYAQRR